MYIEVAFASARKQLCIPVKLQGTVSVKEAIIKTGITDQFPEIDLSTMKVGVFGKLCGLDKIVEQGDRVEIYRPLHVDPMEARRNRAVKD